MGALGFSDIYGEVRDLRFNSNAAKVAQCKRWVNQAEISLWNAAPWTFKRMPATNLTVTAGVASEPADFGKVIRLYDPRGYELPYMRPDEFEEDFTAPSPVPAGNAEAYTVINRQIIVGPGETGTFKLAYRRRYSHFDNDPTPGVVAPGVMSADTDTPIWDSEHHYILVPWAMRLGEVLEADPNSGQLEQVVEGLKTMSMFQAMREELCAGVAEQIPVWGGT